jgi:hypothetical protein
MNLLSKRLKLSIEFYDYGVEYTNPKLSREMIRNGTYDFNAWFNGQHSIREKEFDFTLPVFLVSLFTLIKNLMQNCRATHFMLFEDETHR